MTMIYAVGDEKELADAVRKATADDIIEVPTEEMSKKALAALTRPDQGSVNVVVR